MTEAGFTNLEGFSSLAGEAFKLGQRLYIVAVKADVPAPEQPVAVAETAEALPG